MAHTLHIGGCAGIFLITIVDGFELVDASLLKSMDRDTGHRTHGHGDEFVKSRMRGYSFTIHLVICVHDT